VARRTRVRLGLGDLTDVQRVETRIGPGVKSPGAEVVAKSEALRTHGVSFAGGATISTISSRGVEDRLFTGIVDRVELADADTVVVRLRTGDADLQESRTGGLAVFQGTDVREVVYGLLRTAGLSESGMDLGWLPGPTRPFLVCVAAGGVAVEGSLDVAGLTITSVNPFHDRVPAEPFGDSFRNSKSWVLTSVQARTIYDAEMSGLAHINVGLSVMRALSAFSYPVLAGQLRAYDRRSSLSRIAVPESVAVSELTSTAGWFRVLKDPRAETPLIDMSTVLSDAEREFRGRVELWLAKAFVAWQNAADSESDLDRVAFLSRSMEAYANRAAAEPLFTKEELAIVRTAVRSGASGLARWSAEQQKRLDGAVSGLNNAPLKTKFFAAIAEANISVTSAEVDVLWTARGLRNRLEHGGDASAVEYGVIRQAIGILNRLLVETVVSEGAERSDR